MQDRYLFRGKRIDNGELTENEAIEELQNSIELAKMCTQNYERKREIQGYEMATEALREVQQYRAIGTPEECKIAVEKQRPKKPINPDDDYGTFKCPNCNGLIFTEDRFETHKYCLLCGQKLDWRDEE